MTKLTGTLKLFARCTIPLLLMSIAPTGKAGALLLSLDSSSLTGGPGSSVLFTGTISNNSGEEIFLNGAGATLTYSELTFDVTPFFTFTPASLPDGQSYVGPIFGVAISAIALDGDYSSNIFSVQGGTDSSTFDDVGDVVFDVVVTSSSSVPEPGTGALVSLIGVFAFVNLLRIRRGVWRFVFPGATQNDN